ncbi:MAG: LiaF transmembrane domain-containing protein [Candidatus Promineifilaceae bacterium]
MEDLKQAEKDMLEPAEQNNSWVGGVILIVVGIVFLFVNYTEFHIDNWWALFILIPVAASWSEAFRAMQRDGGVSQEVTNKLTGSLFPLFVACIFLFSWDWGQVWPGFIILAGISALFGSRYH